MENNDTNFPPLNSNKQNVIPKPIWTVTELCHFSHDVSTLPDTPPKYAVGHRRAWSEVVTLLDDISFDSDLGFVGGLDAPSCNEDTEEDLLSMYNNSQISVTQTHEDNVSCYDDRPRVNKHQHSMSMDCCVAYNQEETCSSDAKKSMSADKLAELAIVDPKRAKRIWANRQSAARSKERKMRYITELERKIQTLQTEATSLSAQLPLLQRDVHGLTVENSELKLRLQTAEQQGCLQHALNETLKEEIQHLKVVTGQNLTNGGPMVNLRPSYGPHHQFHPSNQATHTMLTAQQFQQPQTQSWPEQYHLFQPHLHQFQQRHQFQHQQHQNPD